MVPSAPPVLSVGAGPSTEPPIARQLLTGEALENAFSMAHVPLPSAPPPPGTPPSRAPLEITTPLRNMLAEIQSRIIAIEHSPQAAIPPEQVAQWTQQMLAVGQQMNEFRAHMPQAVRDTFNQEIEPLTQFAHQ